MYSEETLRKYVDNIHKKNKALNEITDEMGNFDSLIVDFSDLEYISSAGLRVLIATGKKLKPEGIPFVIKVNDTINEILVMSGFDKILNLE